MALSNKIRFSSKEEAVPTHLLLLFKAWWEITCVTYITCTGALWAKRGERGIVHKKECEAWDEGRRKMKRLLPVHELHEHCIPIGHWWRIVLACLSGTK